MKKILRFAKIAPLTLFSLLVIACENLDVVGTGSIQSFDQVLRQSPQLITGDGGCWSLAAPDGSARFLWAKDFAETALDAALELDAAPFIAAGLDPAKLPGHFTLGDGRLVTGRDLGREKLQYRGEATPLASYEHIVKLERKAIGYHADLDHYGVDLGEGNLFEWAKDLRANDKDIVFVLNPDPFIAAGVDPHRIEGWVFDKVKVDDEKGRPIQVDKFLKPFNLF